MSERKQPEKVAEFQTVKLEFPIEHAGETISSLTVTHRLRAADFRGIVAENMKFDDMMTLVSRLFGVPATVVDKLDSVDFFACSKVVNDFLPGGQQTGESR
jgi:hypothetical protein